MKRTSPAARHPLDESMPRPAASSKRAPRSDRRALRHLRAAIGLVVVLLSSGCAENVDRVAAAAIAPTGALRVAVGVAPSGSPFWATRDPDTHALRGVTVDLGRAAARRLGVPLELVAYANSGEITAAAATGAWDVSFMPRDPARDPFVDAGPAFVLYESSYIVRPGSEIRASRDVDRAGTRVGVVAGTSTSRTVAATVRNASVEVFPQAAVAMDALAGGRIDALAMGREALVDFTKRAPGTQLLDEVIQSTGVVVVVPKGRPATRAWAARFLDDAKADGTVRRALDAAGFADAPVAPR